MGDKYERVTISFVMPEADVLLIDTRDPYGSMKQYLRPWFDQFLEKGWAVMTETLTFYQSESDRNPGDIVFDVIGMAKRVEEPHIVRGDN